MEYVPGEQLLYVQINQIDRDKFKQNIYIFTAFQNNMYTSNY